MNTKIRVVGNSGISTTLVGTDTNHVLHVVTSTTFVLVSGTGTTLPWYWYNLASIRWYRYHPCSGTGNTSRDCLEMVDSL